MDVKTFQNLELFFLQKISKMWKERLSSYENIYFTIILNIDILLSAHFKMHNYDDSPLCIICKKWWFVMYTRNMKKVGVVFSNENKSKNKNRVLSSDCFQKENQWSFMVRRSTKVLKHQQRLQKVSPFISKDLIILSITNSFYRRYKQLRFKSA